MKAIRIQSETAYTTLCAEQCVSRPLEEVFAFFADARNLEQITPPFLRFSVRSMTTPTIQQGTEITYRLRLHHLPISWVSRIETWEPPYRFVDVQIRGPFRLWRHQHEFTPESQGTSIRDTVHYRAPGFWLHRTPLLWWIDNDMRRIFTYRQQIIERLFGAAKL